MFSWPSLMFSDNQAWLQSPTRSRGKMDGFNALKTNSSLRYLKAHFVPRSKHLNYKNRSVYDGSGTSRCLFSDKYKTHKYSVGRGYSCWMLNW